MSYSDILKFKHLGEIGYRNRLLQLQSFETLVKSADNVLYYDARKDLILANGITPDRSGVKAEYNYTNLIPNPLLTNANADNCADGYGDVEGYASGTVICINGIQTILSRYAYDSWGIYVNCIVGHKYYISYKVKADSDLIYAGISGLGVKAHSGNGNFEKLGCIITATATTHYIMVEDDRTSGWTQVQITEPIFIDLTVLGLDSISIAEANQLFTFTPTSAIIQRGNNIAWNNFAGNSASGLVIENGKVFRRLDGTDDFGSMVNTLSIDITSAPLAIYATIRVSPSAVSNSFILCKNLSGLTDVQYGIMWNSTLKNITLYLENVSRDSSGDNSVLNNVWYNVGFIWDGTNIKYYVNGLQVGIVSPYTGSLTSRPTTAIGRRGAVVNNPFKGDLASLTIYAGAKATEANALKAEAAISKAYIGG
jgi:hypothetical protein